MTKDNLENCSISELRVLAREKKVPYYGRLKKQELITKLSDLLQSEEASQVKALTPSSDSMVVYPFKRQERKEIHSSKLFTRGGVLEIIAESGYGFLRQEKLTPSDNDIYVSPSQIRRFNLRNGDMVVGQVRAPKDNEKYLALLRVESINSLEPEKAKMNRCDFEHLVPIYPDSRIKLEGGNVSSRLIDLIAPIGLGQRGLIVAPPKAGKTMLLKNIANSMTANNPDLKLMVLLIDERPEEVTDMQRSIRGKVISSTFDMTPDNHIRVAEMVLERAKRLVELKQNVVILLDSITRLARAYNLVQPSTGKTLSGGLDPGALHRPKRFFGAARNIEDGGSLTIIATALVETGSRMDDMIFEEFKGTGNMELHLDRKISEKRIFPAVDVKRSGTRKEELLLSEEELEKMWNIRKSFNQQDAVENLLFFLNGFKKTKNNQEFMATIK